MHNLFILSLHGLSITPVEKKEQEVDTDTTISYSSTHMSHELESYSYKSEENTREKAQKIQYSFSVLLCIRQ